MPRRYAGAGTKGGGSSAKSPGSSFWQVVGAFLAPTTTVTALLFYFGWVRASTTYSYFGVDVERTLGFSASDYVLRSSTVVFTPLAGLVLLALVALLGYRAADAYLTHPEDDRRLQRFTVGVAIAAAVFLVTGAILLFEIGWLSRTPLAKPLVLGTGAVLASYAAHLRGLPTRGHRAGPSPFTVLYHGVLAALLVLTLFWAASILAHDQGLGAAHSIERNLLSRIGVVVYTRDGLYITGPGVKFEQLDHTNSAYRFRYTGLRLLARTADGGYVLLPRGWTHTNGSPAYILLPTNGIRVDLQALPAD